MRLSWMVLLVAGCPTPLPDADLSDPGEVGQVCATAEAPRQLRLLTRREYDATVRDILGVGEGGGCSTDVECDLEIQSCIDRVCTLDTCDVVTFQLVWGDAGEVVVAGELNGWGATAAEGGWPLVRVPGADLWYLKRSLPEGEHAYKFVVDGTQWLQDAANPWTTDDGFGGFNSVAAVRCDASELTADPSRPSAGLLPETRPAHWSFDNHAASGVVSAAHLEAYLQASERVVRAVDTAALAGCDPGDDACVLSSLRRLLRRLFRRPPTDAVLDRYADLVASGGLALALEAALVSPMFLYRSELGRPEDGGFRLDAWETASALSYFLIGSAPDDPLLDAAASGALDSRAGIEAEARRLLDDPRARETARAFVTQWLGIERALTGDKRADLFPMWDVGMRTSAVKETQVFYEHLVFDGGGRFDDLLTSPTHWVDARLASLYGLEGVDGADRVAVDILDPPRPGVLGQASVLASTAYSDQTSPVRRGLFVRERLLCQDLGVPPANAGGVPEVDPGATTRERFSQHMDDRVCAGCHKYIDPIGFGFEHYDPIGRFRETDAGQPIDATGEVEDIERTNSTVTVPFHDLAELADLLAASEAAPRCFTRELYRFAVGFREAEDDCAVDALADTFAASGGDVQELMVAIATSPTFTRRVAAEEAE